jgi:hypothetical protein
MLDGDSGQAAPQQPVAKGAAASISVTHFSGRADRLAFIEARKEW